MNLRRSLTAIRQHRRVQQVLRPVRRRVIAIDKQASSRVLAFTRSRFGRPLFERYVKRKNAYTAQPIARLLDGTEPRTLTSSKVWFRFDALAATRYLLTIETDRDLPPDTRAAVIEYRFVDRRGSLMESVDVGKAHSARHGYHEFIPRAPSGRVSEYVVLSPPKVWAIDIGLARLDHADVTLTSVTLAEIGPRTIIPAYDLPVGEPRSSLRLAVIADTFTVTALRYEAYVCALSVDGWTGEFDEFAPDALIIESAWNGNDGEWFYCVAGLKRDDRRLPDLVDHAKARGTPVLFWNKEDPAHYDDFIEAARLCDIVATTDARVISRYVGDLGHDRVFALPFCIQPDIHNPRQPEDGVEERLVTAGFLGSWWAEKFDERRQSQEQLFAGAADFGLEIFDRYLTFNDHERYRIPPRWLHDVHGSLDYAQALSAYRRYAVLLNVNTVTDSPTMFSRRALEASACGALVVTNPSVGTSIALGEHVISVGDAASCRDELAHLHENLDELARRAHRAYRHTHRRHRWSDRLSAIAEHCNIALPARKTPKVSVVLVTMRVEGAGRIIDYLASIDDPGIELETIVLTAFDPAELRAVRSADAKNVNIVRQLDGETLGACLNRGAATATGEFVAKIDDDDLYGPNYFQDLLIAIDFSRADITGKHCHYQHFENGDRTVLRYPGLEHRFTRFVSGSSLLARISVFEKVEFPERRVGEDTGFIRRALDAGLRLYSADRFSYVACRRADLSTHTWKADDHEIISLDTSRPWGPGLPLDLLTV